VQHLSKSKQLNEQNAQTTPTFSVAVQLIRMLIVGYVFAIRSERALCREVQVNLAYRWFCGPGIDDRIPGHSTFTRAHNERFRDETAYRCDAESWRAS
jgi:transposase